MNDDNRRIAKNTIYLYSRMIVMMLVTLYTSRIILEKLGVDDYGIYQAVGGIVGFLSFINGVLTPCERLSRIRFTAFPVNSGFSDYYGSSVAMPDFQCLPHSPYGRSGLGNLQLTEVVGECELSDMLSFR